MSEKVDVYMPVYVGDYLASTSHLSAEQHGAYFLLLLHEWKNGYLPNSAESLRRIARIESSDAWSIAWASLKQFFSTAEDGSLFQGRLEKERQNSLSRRHKSVEKAKTAAAKRWEKENMLGASTKHAPSNAQAVLDSCPSTSTSTTYKDLNPCDSPKGSSPNDNAGLVSTKPAERTYEPLVEKPGSSKSSKVDDRHTPFKQALEKYWSFKNPELDMPWSGAEAKAVADLLAASPNLTLESFQKCLNNRSKSQVNHSERPLKWLRSATDYAGGPLDQFKNPLQAPTAPFEPGRHEEPQQRMTDEEVADFYRPIRDRGGHVDAGLLALIERIDAQRAAQPN